MTRAFSFLLRLAVGGWLVCTPAAALAQEDLERMAPDPDRELVYYSCVPCHSMKIVLQQRLDRETWDEVLVWMRENGGMPALDPKDREAILDYLAKHYSPERPRERR